MEILVIWGLAAAAVVLLWGGLTSTLPFELWSLVRVHFIVLFLIIWFTSVVLILTMISRSWHWGSPLQSSLGEVENARHCLIHGLIYLSEHQGLLHAEVNELSLSWMAITTLASWVSLMRPKTGSTMIIESRSTLHVQMMSSSVFALFLLPVWLDRFCFDVPVLLLSLLLKLVLEITTRMHDIWFIIFNALVLWGPLRLIAFKVVRERWLPALIQCLKVAMTILVNALAWLRYVWWVWTRTTLMILSAAAILDWIWLLCIQLFVVSWCFILLL